MKVGDKIKGFECYSETPSMYKYRGKIGTIIGITSIDVEVMFLDGDSWYYPITECEKHLVTDVSDSIVESIISQFKQRSEVGIAKYGTTLERKDLSTLEWIEHAKQEAMDFILYLERLKQEMK